MKAVFTFCKNRLLFFREWIGDSIATLHFKI